jgi:hypothetical protein
MKSLSWSDLVISKKIQKLEATELSLLNSFGNYVMKSLPKLSPHREHPMRSIANEARHTLVQEYESSQSLYEAIHKVDTVLKSNIPNFPQIADIGDKSWIGITPEKKLELDMMIETGFRLHFTKEYFARMQKAIDNGEIDQALISSSRACRLLDSIMLGTATERIKEHIDTYGTKNPRLTQDQYQSCLYALYDPEVETVAAAMQTLKNLDTEDKKMKTKKKVIPQAARLFLLDTVELNTKVRCMMAWSDPNYTGFKPLPDDHTVNVVELVKARKDFFLDGAMVGEKFVEEILTQRREFYQQKQETRKTMVHGFLFFIGTCLLDWAVCVV